MSETTFRHSTARVPRLYKEAGKIVQKVREEGGSFKGLVFQTKHKRLKGIYALVAETLRYGSEVDSLLRKTQILVKEPRLDPWVTRVLITELLWRKRPLSGDAIPLKIVKSYEPEFIVQQAEMPSQLSQPVCRASRPRFVRINTLKASEDEILNYFTQEGWHEVKEIQKGQLSDDQKYANFLQRISSLTGQEFLQDVHIPNLLVFPGNMEFYNLDYYHNGSLLLQDKASCMSAHLLNAPPGSTVLDMCAAPGMKTTHIAATIKNIGTIYAIEKHPGRYTSLCNVLSQAGATCVKPILGSSLNFSDKELPDVEYIIVDPTCSGSGMTNRKELFSDTDDISKERLEKLASFQCAILRHAMLNFPKAKRIVYSTCSLCPEENEAVIEEVLKTTPPNFKPVIPAGKIQWMKRGSSSYKYGDFGLYAQPQIDLTNGFFVAVFERTENEFVPRNNMSLKISREVPLKKKNKKKDQRASNVGVASAPELALNPAFERMKRAMGNLNAVAENQKNLDNPTDSDESTKNMLSKKNKKKKKHEAEDSASIDSSPKIKKPDSVVSNLEGKVKKRKSSDGSMEVDCQIVKSEREEQTSDTDRKKKKRSKLHANWDLTEIEISESAAPLNKIKIETGLSETVDLDKDSHSNSKKNRKKKRTEIEISESAAPLNKIKIETGLSETEDLDKDSHSKKNKKKKRTEMEVSTSVVSLKNIKTEIDDLDKDSSSNSKKNKRKKSTPNMDL